jgi:hypothetical protein
LWAIGTVLAAAILMFCYLRIAGATQVNSDGAGNALQAWDMLHGNLLLHGWWVTDVSFYTTELPEYMIVAAFAGLRPEVVHICAALTYTLLVLLAAFVARGRARGAEGVVRALLAAVVMLVPQPTGPTVVLLGSPDHVGTAVPVLLFLLLLDRAPRRWYVPVCAAVLLAWSMVGDPLIEVIGVIPLALACLVRAGRIRRPRAAWYELSLAGAAVVAVPLAAAANWLLRDLDGFTVAKAWYGVVSWPVFVRDLPLAWQSVLVLFGADYAGVHGGLNVAFAIVHLAGVAVVLAAVAVAAWRLARRDDLIADVLVLAVVANVVAYLVTVRIDNIFGAHEIGPVMSLGAALAGRTLGGPLLRARLRPVLAAGLACYAITLGFAAASGQAAPTNVGLTAWLTRHDLHSGLAPYWEASSVTVDSGGTITLLSVVPHGHHGHLVPQEWGTKVGLADPAARTANFVVLTPAESVSRKSALATFGQPAAVYRYKSDTILVWHKNLLRQLGPPAP